MVQINKVVFAHLEADTMSCTVEGVIDLFTVEQPPHHADIFAKRFECDQNLWTTAALRRQLQSLGFYYLWHWGGCAIHTLMLLLSMKLPIGIPVPIDPHRP